MADYATKQDLKKIDIKIDVSVARLEQKIDQAVTDLSDIIANLAQSMHGELVEVRKEIVDLKASHNKLLNTIDGFLKRIDNYETEQTARDAQFARLLEWAREVSDKTGIPLKGF
jgi:septal ring factor EnvC (AmiA/AmiB activator)